MQSSYQNSNLLNDDSINRVASDEDIVVVNEKRGGGARFSVYSVLLLIFVVVGSLAAVSYGTISFISAKPTSLEEMTKSATVVTPSDSTASVGNIVTGKTSRKGGLYSKTAAPSAGHPTLKPTKSPTMEPTLLLIPIVSAYGEAEELQETVSKTVTAKNIYGKTQPPSKSPSRPTTKPTMLATLYPYHHESKAEERR